MYIAGFFIFFLFLVPAYYWVITPVNWIDHDQSNYSSYAWDYLIGDSHMSWMTEFDTNKTRLDQGVIIRVS